MKKKSKTEKNIDKKVEQFKTTLQKKLDQVIKEEKKRKIKDKKNLIIVKMKIRKKIRRKKC